MTPKGTPGAVGTNSRAHSQQTSALSLPDPNAYRKRVATVQAKLAIRGFALHELADGRFLATAWNRAAYLIDLDAAELFLRRIGGRP